MKILAIGAHFDDIELGCGGAIARHVDDGDQVRFLVATHSGYTAPSGTVVRAAETARQEGMAAAALLGVTDVECPGFDTNHLVFNDELSCALLRVIESMRPDLIYTHWDGDVHHDHQNLARATLAASRHVQRVLMYRSNYYDGSDTFRGNFYVDISQTLDRKIAAILAHKSEFDRVGQKWTDHCRNSAANEGLKCGVQYAESFQVVKYLY